MSVYSQDELVACKACKVKIEELDEKSVLSRESLILIKHPFRVVEINFPIKRDSGELEIIKGYRVLYNNILGPGKGGIRFHSSVDEEETAELAFIMTIKNSLAGLPFGGAKGSVKINPLEYSENELEKISRSYVRALFEVLGPQKDIPAPDVGTNQKIMDWMKDEYEKILGSPAPAFITGKPIEKGGIPGREEATALGGFYVLEEAIKHTKISLKDKKDIKVAVQGFGNVGAHIAKILYSNGYKVVAISDASTALYSNEGIDVDKFFDCSYKEKKLLANCPEDLKNSVEVIDGEKLLELDTDVLIPAALGGVINASNMDKIKSKIVLSLANAAILPSAEKYLVENGVFVIPDIIANSGGVIVSYFEWKQNLENEKWTKEKVYSELKNKITSSFIKSKEEAEKLNLSLSEAAFKIAVERIAENYKRKSV